jgi:hypothetical protein
VCTEDYINPTVDGVLSWRSITSCASDSDIGMENWQQRLHEVSTRRCTQIDRIVRWVGTEMREPPSFHGINDLEEFLMRYEEEYHTSRDCYLSTSHLRLHLQDGGVCTNKI